MYLVILMFLGVCAACFFTKKKKVFPRSVSIHQPHWCPTNVDCDEYMRKKAYKRVKEYFQEVQKVNSPFIFNVEYAINFIQPKKSDDALYEKEFERVFRIEFQHMIPFAQLAKREGKKYTHYFKKK